MSGFTTEHALGLTNTVPRDRDPGTRTWRTAGARDGPDGKSEEPRSYIYTRKGAEDDRCNQVLGEEESSVTDLIDSAREIHSGIASAELSSVWVKINDEKESNTLSQDWKGPESRYPWKANSVPHRTMTEEVKSFQIFKPWLIETAERAAAPAGVTVEHSTRTLCHGYTGSKHHRKNGRGGLQWGRVRAGEEEGPGERRKSEEHTWNMRRPRFRICSWPELSYNSRTTVLQRYVPIPTLGGKMDNLAEKTRSSAEGEAQAVGTEWEGWADGKWRARSMFVYMVRAHIVRTCERGPVFPPPPSSDALQAQPTSPHAHVASTRNWGLFHFRLSLTSTAAIPTPSAFRHSLTRHLACPEEDCNSRCIRRILHSIIRWKSRADVYATETSWYWGPALLPSPLPTSLSSCSPRGPASPELAAYTRPGPHADSGPPERRLLPWRRLSSFFSIRTRFRVPHFFALMPSYRLRSAQRKGPARIPFSQALTHHSLLRRKGRTSAVHFRLGPIYVDSGMEMGGYRWRCRLTPVYARCAYLFVDTTIFAHALVISSATMLRPVPMRYTWHVKDPLVGDPMYDGGPGECIGNGIVCKESESLWEMSRTPQYALGFAHLDRASPSGSLVKFTEALTMRCKEELCGVRWSTLAGVVSMGREYAT
ncbi:hypothetical protein BJ912DRAFT_1043420 [Pholiota molesta]|nr:hypothetical protein BJ912DRAFT_1043420 [Pholiota molesta]